MTELHEILPGLIEDGLSQAEDATTDELGPACEELCVLYRASAITALLIELDIDQFHHMLMRSGLTWIHLLERIPPTEKSRSRFAKLTRTQAFLDCVAVERYDLAQRIGTLSAASWLEQFEYQDDYCYALFLHKMATGADRGVLEGVLARFEDSLEGAPSANLDLCKALLAGDRDGFASAFPGKLRGWESELAFQEKSLSRDDFAYATGRFVYVEGLALVRLAQRLGITTEEEYKYLPKEASMPMRAPFPDDRYPR